MRDRQMKKRFLFITTALVSSLNASDKLNTVALGDLRQDAREEISMVHKAEFTEETFAFLTEPLKRIAKESNPRSVVRVVDPKEVKTAMVKMYSAFISVFKKLPLEGQKTLINQASLLEDGLFQKASGEGKTRTIGLLSALLFLTRGEKVDVMSSSIVLSKSAHEELKPFFDKLGISSGVIGEDKNVYSKDIVFGDMGAFEEGYARQKFSGSEGRGDRAFQRLIIDEVDNTLLDQLRSGLRLTNKVVPGMEFIGGLLQELYVYGKELESNFVTKEGGVYYSPKGVGVAEVVYNKALFFNKKIGQFVDEYLEKHKSVFSKDLVAYARCMKEAWAKSLLFAMNVRENVDFVVIRNENGKAIDVKILDSENTGVTHKNLQWMHGRHEFLCIRNGVAFEPVSFSDWYIPNRSYVNFYEGRIFGLSGTLGGEAEKEAYRDIYNVSNFFDIPRNNPSKLKELGAVLLETEEEVYLRIKSAIEQNSLIGRGVLVIVPNTAKGKELRERLEKELRVGAIIEDYNDSLTTARFLKEAIAPRTVIISTNLGGRGTDFLVSKQMNKNGGLHVILTFIPKDETTMNQAFARTARNGQEGSCEIIANRQRYEALFDGRSLTVADVRAFFRARRKATLRYYSHVLKVQEDREFKKQLTFLTLLTDLRRSDFKGYADEQLIQMAHYYKKDFPEFFGFVKAYIKQVGKTFPESIEHNASDACIISRENLSTLLQVSSIKIAQCMEYFGQYQAKKRMEELQKETDRVARSVEHVQSKGFELKLHYQGERALFSALSDEMKGELSFKELERRVLTVLAQKNPLFQSSSYVRRQFSTLSLEFQQELIWALGEVTQHSIYNVEQGICSRVRENGRHKIYLQFVKNEGRMEVMTLSPNVEKESVWLGVVQSMREIHSSYVPDRNIDPVIDKLLNELLEPQWELETEGVPDSALKDLMSKLRAEYSRPEFIINPGFRAKLQRLGYLRDAILLEPHYFELSLLGEIEWVMEDVAQKEISLSFAKEYLEGIKTLNLLLLRSSKYHINQLIAYWLKTAERLLSGGVPLESDTIKQIAGRVELYYGLLRVIEQNMQAIDHAKSIKRSRIEFNIIPVSDLYSKSLREILSQTDASGTLTTHIREELYGLDVVYDGSVTIVPPGFFEGALVFLLSLGQTVWGTERVIHGDIPTGSALIHGGISGLSKFIQKLKNGKDIALDDYIKEQVLVYLGAYYANVVKGEQTPDALSPEDRALYEVLKNVADEVAKIALTKALDKALQERKERFVIESMVKFIQAILQENRKAWLEALVLVKTGKCQFNEVFSEALEVTKPTFLENLQDSLVCISAGVVEGQMLGDSGGQFLQKALGYVALKGAKQKEQLKALDAFVDRFVRDGTVALEASMRVAKARLTAEERRELEETVDSLYGKTDTGLMLDLIAPITDIIASSANEQYSQRVVAPIRDEIGRWTVSQPLELLRQQVEDRHIQEEAKRVRELVTLREMNTPAVVTRYPAPSGEAQDRIGPLGEKKPLEHKTKDTEQLEQKIQELGGNPKHLLSYLASGKFTDLVKHRGVETPLCVALGEKDSKELVIQMAKDLGSVSSPMPLEDFGRQMGVAMEFWATQRGYSTNESQRLGAFAKNLVAGPGSVQGMIPVGSQWSQTHGWNTCMRLKLKELTPLQQFELSRDFIGKEVMIRYQLGLMERVPESSDKRVMTTAFVDNKSYAGLDARGKWHFLGMLNKNDPFCVKEMPVVFKALSSSDQEVLHTHSLFSRVYTLLGSRPSLVPYLTARGPLGSALKYQKERVVNRGLETPLGIATKEWSVSEISKALFESGVVLNTNSGMTIQEFLNTAALSDYLSTQGFSESDAKLGALMCSSFGSNLPKWTIDQWKQSMNSSFAQELWAEQTGEESTHLATSIGAVLKLSSAERTKVLNTPVTQTDLGDYSWDVASSYEDNVRKLKCQLTFLQSIPEWNRDVSWREQLQEISKTWEMVKMGDPEAVAAYQDAIPEGVSRAGYTVDPIGSEICEQIALATEELGVYFGLDPSTATTLGNTIAFVVPFGLGTKITQGTRVITTGFKSISGKFKATPVSWTAPVGTKQTYKVFQRTDIDWKHIRTGADDKFKGKTNLEACLSGASPQLIDGSYVRIHHIGQDSRGALIEASGSIHDFGSARLSNGKSKFTILHSQHGPKKAHPDFPVDHTKWGAEKIAYWKTRAKEVLND
jgi:predicted DNA-binding protein (UPF0251 family)